MNVNFEAIEKAWFKPKKDSVLDVTEKILKDDIEYFRETEQDCIANLLECILENIQELKKENKNGRIF